MNRPVRGVGFQFNPSIVNDIGEKEFSSFPIDFAEILCDAFAAPLDCGYVIDPGIRPIMERLGEQFPLLAHSNYGEEFGFDPLAESVGVLRHVPLIREMKSPWVADHLFYGGKASSYTWSSPIQFSKQELERVAGRAAQLQDMIKIPLLHENAFYYGTFPGSTMAEAEFIAGLLEKAKTYMLLDLHNVYTNSVDHKGYDRWEYLRTIPLDRVIEIHIAGGQWIDDWYHDFHNNPVPEPVWEMLDHVLRRAPNVEAVTLEVQGPAHNARSRVIDGSWTEMTRHDLQRAKTIWNATRGPAAT